MIRLSSDTAAASVTLEEHGATARARATTAPSARVARRLVFLVLMALVAIGTGCRERNGNDGAAASTGIPAANFTVDVSSGAADLPVQFTDTSTGDIDSWFWEFSNGETSTLPNPMVIFDTAGTFDVRLTVTGSRGTSVKESMALIEVLDAPVAGFSCDTSAGFAPLTVNCASSAVGATSTTWTFTNGTTLETILSTDANATVELPTGGDWTVRQDVINAAGSDSFTPDPPAPIVVQEITIAVAPVVGPGPGTATLTIDLGNVSGFGTWKVDGVVLTNVVLTGFDDVADSEYDFDFDSPGTYTVTFEYGSFRTPEIVVRDFEYVVPYAVPTAGFLADQSAGPGPLTVVFTNLSLGEITEAVWDFGDTTTCVWPAPSDPVADPRTPCNASSPSHTYDAIGRFDVSLRVTGPDAAGVANAETDTSLQASAVTVTILDPGFEAQVPGDAIDGAWSAFAGDGTETSQHVALSDTQPDGGDAEMPTEGDQWAVLDGLGTDGSDVARDVANRIETHFVLPADRPVLEFDYMLLFAEPPAGFVRDAMTATVTGPDDANPLLDKTVEVTAAIADAWTAYDGGSIRFPTLDGSDTRMTPLRVASLDVASAFPSADADTQFTLAIRLTNDVNTFRPPRAYVDDVRFVARSETALVADFDVPSVVVAGEPATFTDLTTCPEPLNSPCSAPSSWRWDFGTRESIVAPVSTGSSLEDPTYVFDAPDDYDVTLWARNADQAAARVRTVTVLEAPVSIPAVDSVTPSGPFWLVQFRSDSTADPDDDDVVAWSWDFAGWGDDPELFDDENPGPIEIRQAGTWTIRLTITTAQGLEATGSVDVVLE